MVLKCRLIHNLISLCQETNFVFYCYYHRLNYVTITYSKIYFFQCGRLKLPLTADEWKRCLSGSQKNTNIDQTSPIPLSTKGSVNNKIKCHLRLNYTLLFVLSLKKNKWVVKVNSCLIFFKSHFLNKQKH